MSLAPLSSALQRASGKSRSTRRDPVASWQPLLIADVAVLAMAALVLPRGLAIAFAGLVLAGLALRGCYRPRFTGQVGALLGKVVTTVAMAAGALATVSPAATAMLLLRVTPFVAVTFVVARAVASVGVRAMRSTGHGTPTLIVGAGGVGVRMAKNLLDHPEYGLSPVGVLDDEVDDDLPLPLLGNTSELEQVVKRFDIRHVVVAFGKAAEVRMVEVLRTCERLAADVWVVPRMFELGVDLSSTDELWGIPVVHVGRRALRSGQWRLKRAFDVALSGTLLILAAPVMITIALAVKMTSPGPVFFRQPRVGQNGKLVDVLKFRSMTVNTDSNETWNVTTDLRVTKIGRILRPTSLDELPQLLNVLRGDMSLVGPRPERPHFVELFSGSVPGYAHRHRVPVGLTGLSQVNGLRGDTSIEDRATFDNLYIDNWSLWGDIVILVRTVWAVIRPPASIKIAAPSPVESAIDTEVPASVEPVIDVTDVATQPVLSIVTDQSDSVSS